MGDGPARLPRGRSASSARPVSSPADPRPARARWGEGRHYAALDLGTNNCRLLIARPQGSGFAVIDAFSRIVRLGEGLATTGRLSDAATERTLAALRICADKLRRRNVALARSVATEACRRASNGPEFIARVYRETGIALDIITAEEEARLAVLGCHALLEPGDGPALVFDDYPSMKKAIDDPDLDVTADHVLILRNAGPQGGPGMPEWGMLPIPTKLVKQGVRDMVRLSDARMSGTSYGACILHVAPESFVGGPLALVRNGDRITLDVAARTINFDVSQAEFAKRRAEWKPPGQRFERGYGWMFSRHIKQANEGCDFDFLETGFGKPVDEPSIY